MAQKLYTTSELRGTVPPPLCGHEAPMVWVRGYKAMCPVCGSFWDLESLASGSEYDASYPLLRSHYAPEVGKNKVRTLKSWFETLGINLSSLIVCEVGFGGGHCLKFLREASGNAFGIEMIQENIDHARSLGLEPDRLLQACSLPPKLPSKVDLWLFQDSFEHLESPAEFIDWVVANSSAHAQLMLILPEAGSISERLLGRFWPHRLKDHRFHWSRKGITGFLSMRSFEVSTFFRPTKYLSLVTLVAHLIHKMSMPNLLIEWIERGKIFKLCFHFNTGEMGILVKKSL